MVTGFVRLETLESREQVIRCKHRCSGQEMVVGCQQLGFHSKEEGHLG